MPNFEVVDSIQGGNNEPITWWTYWIVKSFIRNKLTVGFVKMYSVGNNAGKGSSKGGGGGALHTVVSEI